MSDSPERIAPATAGTARDGDVKVAHLAYALQALGFFNGLTYIAAIVIDYVKLDDVRGTWLESHFRWQIRTFWWSLAWMLLGALSAFVLIGYVILAVTGIWLIYRIAKGWLRLAERRPMYTPAESVRPA